MPVNKIKKEPGFTLIEMAVVLVIVGILVGGFIGSFAQRIETTKRENTKKQLEDIKMAFLGFVSAEGRLPCPALASVAAGEEGEEQPVGGGVCSSLHGFVPGKTLGISGTYNQDNLLIDSWNSPIRYSVTGANSNAFTKAPEPDGIKGIWNNTLHVEYPLNPDLIICGGDSESETDCTGTPPPYKIVDTAPFIILSLGEDGNDFITDIAPGSDQGENAGEATVTANAAGENLAYTVGSNPVFVSKSYSSVDSTAGKFDDLILWVSPYVLYSRMIEAGQLP
jgi:prepilin-type N-terminal cleavage/methylation domain-containing protein